jgi:ABC-type multidrug transport system ATPase subunit
MLHDPDVLILDEPASGLDPATRRELDHFLDGLRKRGKAILLSGHHLRQVEELCDRIVLVHAGRIRAQGTLTELRRTWGTTRYRVLATTPFPGSHPQGVLHAALAETWDEAQRWVAAVAGAGGAVVEMEGLSPTLDEILAKAAQ